MPLVPWWVQSAQTMTCDNPSLPLHGRAERARSGLAAAHVEAPRIRNAEGGTAQHPPHWPAASGRDVPGRRLPSFDPSGHVGADAHSTPRPTDRAARRNVSDDARAARAGHPSGARILKPCVLTVQIARYARVAARSLRASGPLRRRDSGAPVGGMARTERITDEAPLPC